jgi:hypothetical protein
MGNFVPSEVWHHIPYDWEEYQSSVVGMYGLLAQTQSVTEEAMRLKGACLARERIAKAVLREFVTMTYAAGAGHLELDVHVQVCWVAKAEVDWILMEEHEAAKWRILLFWKKIMLLHADRAGMRRVLNVIKPVIEECATYVKEDCPAKCYAVRAGLNGKKVPWHEDDWGLIMSGREVNGHYMEPRDISPFCEDELLHVTGRYADVILDAGAGDEVDQVDQDDVLATLPWRFWAEQIMRVLEGYMMERGNWCKMTVEVAQGKNCVLDGVADDVEDEEYLEEYLVTGEGPPPSGLPCLHSWQLNKDNSNMVEADQFATVLTMLEANGHRRMGILMHIHFRERRLRVG